MRGKKAPVRNIKPDEVYNSVLVAKFINRVMYGGKKDTARKLVYAAIKELASKTKQTDALKAFEVAIENVKPKIEVRSRRVGGANFQVPVPVPENRQVALGMKWLIEAARSSRKNNEFSVSLARELISSYNKEGVAFKKKEEVFRMAEANKAFAQFA